MKNLEVCVEDGEFSLYAIVIPVGEDISATVYGGTSPHIGASAISVPRPSLSDKTVTSSSTSVFCVTGHKEDELAKAAAARLAAEFNCVANVCAGIRIDSASKADIQRINANFEKLLARIVGRLKQGG